MAMLITRFHKLIQSKVVWYIVLGVIVIAFVGFFTPTMRAAGQQQKTKPAGELFGKKISQDEYRRAYQNTYVWYILSSGRMMPMTDELSAALHSEAWRRVAVLRKAQAEKIPVTDEEVVQQAQAMPLFRTQTGAFDINIYKAVLQQIGMSSSQAEELFREQITIYKLMSRPAQAALISPFELKKAYHLYTDRFVLDYAVLPRSQVEKTVKVSEADARAVYDENPAAFTMPAKVRVSYVEFPVGSFLKDAVVPEGAALQVYNRNIENYRIETTNGDVVAEYKPFESVENEITAELQKYAAIRITAEKASEFVADVTPKSDSAQPDFAGAAAAQGLKIKTLPPFSAKEELPGIDATAPFCQAAFRLENDAYSSFSDAVVGKDAVYVLSLEKRYPAFVPEFDAAKEDALAAARNRAVNKALAARAIEIKETVQGALNDGSEFVSAMKPFGLTVKTTSEFDITTELKDPYAQMLAEKCINVQEGDLCEPVPVEEGVLLAHVALRESTDADIGLPAVRGELAAGLSRSRAQRLTVSWQDSLLVNGKFKDLTRQAAK